MAEALRLKISYRRAGCLCSAASAAFRSSRHGLYFRFIALGPCVFFPPPSFIVKYSRLFRLAACRTLFGASGRISVMLPVRLEKNNVGCQQSCNCVNDNGINDLCMWDGEKNFKKIFWNCLVVKPGVCTFALAKPGQPGVSRESLAGKEKSSLKIFPLQKRDNR